MLFDVFSGLIFFVLHLSPAGSFPPPLSSAKESEYLAKAAEGDSEARNRLIEHNLRLVAHIVKKYYSSGDNQDNLISIGTIGLIKAVDSFDAKKGARLATYAARCIENEILMYFRGQKKISQDISMSEPIDVDGEGNPLTLVDIICCDDTIADDLDLRIKSEQLHTFINEIKDDREKDIIILRYGLYGDKFYTQREVAAKLGISRSYVSRIEKKVLHDLRKKFR